MKYLIDDGKIKKSKCDGGVFGFGLTLTNNGEDQFDLKVLQYQGRSTNCSVTGLNLGYDVSLRVHNSDDKDKVLVFDCKNCTIFSDESLETVEGKFEKTRVATQSNVWFVHCANKKRFNGSNPDVFDCRDDYLNEYKLTFDVTSPDLEPLKKIGKVEQVQNGSGILWKNETRFSWFDDSCNIYQQQELVQDGPNNSTCFDPRKDFLIFSLGWALFLLGLALVLCTVGIRMVQEKVKKGLGSGRKVQAVRFKNSSSPTVSLSFPSGRSCEGSGITARPSCDQKASGDTTAVKGEICEEKLNSTMPLDHEEIPKDNSKFLPTPASLKNIDKRVVHDQLPRPRFAAIVMQKNLQEDPEEEHEYEDLNPEYMKAISSAPGSFSRNEDLLVKNTLLPLSRHES